MAITFRHDAAAVVPPSNASTRKYGQELVQQQQQMKYQSHQAGLDRLFSANQQAGQNRFQLARDRQQNALQMGRDKQQNAFRLDMMDRQKQEQEEARKRDFLENARQQSGRFILDAIDNGEFDEATARQLRQNMVAEAEALGNPNLDAAQRDAVMQKLRAQRTLLLSNRKPKDPPPTAQDQFNQSIVTDPDTGLRYRLNAKGDYEPLPQAAPQRPQSTRQLLQSDPELKKEWTEKAEYMLTEGGTIPSPGARAIADKAVELYDEDQAAWSDQPPEAITEQPIVPAPAPAAAPALPAPAAPPAAAAGQSQNPWAEVIPDPPAPVAPPTAEEAAPVFAPQASPDPVPPPPVEPVQPPAPVVPSPKPRTGPIPLGPPVETPRGLMQYNPNTNQVEPAVEDPFATEQPVPAEPAEPVLPDVEPVKASKPAKKGRKAPKISAPNFEQLMSNSTDDADRAVISGLQGVYGESKSPEVKRAIDVLLNPETNDMDFVSAADYLKSQGIDIESMVPSKPLVHGNKNRNWHSGRGL